MATDILKPLLERTLTQNSGSMELPGGLILNWVNTTVNQTATISLNRPYPNGHLCSVAVGGTNVDSATSDSVFFETAYQSADAVFVKAIKADGTLGNRAMRLISIGY